MKIAVIGSGISGMGAALSLSKEHEVSLYEKDERFGGHSNTVDIECGETHISVDTGFIVYNEHNYPNLSSMFENFNIETKWSDMSFGFSLNYGELEYACDNLDKLFAQRKNILNFAHLKGLKDILRFNKEAPIKMDKGYLLNLSLGDFISQNNYSDWFRDNFILPMAAAIWSTPIYKILDFPAQNFVRFFRNHDLMGGLKAVRRWRTIDQGSQQYVKVLIKTLGKNAYCNHLVTQVQRTKSGVEVSFLDRDVKRFDQVIFAINAPQVFKLLKNKTPEESQILSKFGVSKNRAILHSDENLMPRMQKVWSSWNFISEGKNEDLHAPASVVYWMNRLQTISNDHPIFLSLNPKSDPVENKIYYETEYFHPIIDADSVLASSRINEVQGEGGVWYTGAWLGYGFHEDGLVSSLKVSRLLGSEPQWSKL